MPTRTAPVDLTAVHERFASERCPEARATLIDAYAPMARSLARRYHRRNEPLEDLEQVAMEGLVRALERFDVNRGVPFAGFAIPCIAGTLKRFFRDNGWAVSVPRRIHDLAPHLSRARDELTQCLAAEPTPPQLAAHLDLPVNRVEEITSGVLARSVDSLENPALRAVGAASDRELDRAETRVVLDRALGRLEGVERLIIKLYFSDCLTQGEIGARIGLSQAQVSRRLTTSLGRLRNELAPAVA